MKAFHNLMSVRRRPGQREALTNIPPGATLFKKAIYIAWPAILESFLVALVGVIDTIMVSSLGYYAIAAVGLTHQPKFICLSVFLSLNLAISAITARRKGENNREGANGVLVLSLCLVLILTAIVSTLAVLFANPLLHFAGSAADTHGPAVTYFRIISGGMIFNVIFLAINAAQRGCGNTKIALRTNMVSNVVNVIFNYLLINGHFGFPRLEVKGAAIATVIGTIFACAMSIFSLIKRDRFLTIYMFKHFRAGFSSLRSLLRLSSNTLEEQLFLRIGFLSFAVIAARLGTMAFAAHQVGMNIMHISFSLGDGLSVAAVALVGQSLGEKRADLAQIYGTICQRIGAGFSVLLFVIYLALGKQIFMLFTTEPALLFYEPFLLTMLAIVVFMQISQVVYFGCLRGGGDTRFTALISFLSVSIVRPASSWALCYPLHLGLRGAWVGLLIDQFIRLMLAHWRFKGGKWLTIKI